MLDYLGIFKKLNEEGIKYIIVGGLAVNFYGIPRMTYDIDLLIDLEVKNLKRLITLLKSWGFKPKAPVDIMDFLKEGKREEWLKDKKMKAFTLINPEWPISEIDIIINTPIDYEKASKQINYTKVKDVIIPLISLEDLIKMKKSSNRAQDKSDARLLEKIRREK